MKFQDRVVLKVYLERQDMDRFAGLANEQRRATADFARELILEKLHAGGDGQNLRGDPELPPLPRSTPDTERPVATRQPPTSPRPKSEPAGPLFAGSHPGAGIFNAANDLSEPEYKSHDADCPCFLRESAIKAGLKPDKRVKKEEKKTAKRGRR
jgi:hypothetical protein